MQLTINQIRVLFIQNSVNSRDVTVNTRIWTMNLRDSSYSHDDRKTTALKLVVLLNIWVDYFAIGTDSNFVGLRSSVFSNIEAKELLSGSLKNLEEQISINDIKYDFIKCLIDELKRTSSKINIPIKLHNFSYKQLEVLNSTPKFADCAEMDIGDASVEYNSDVWEEFHNK